MDRKEYKHKWYLDNKDYCKKRSREYYEDNKERIIENNTKWLSNHPEKVKAYRKNYHKIGYRDYKLQRLKRDGYVVINIDEKIFEATKNGKTHIGTLTKVFRDIYGYN